MNDKEIENLFVCLMALASADKEGGQKIIDQFNSISNTIQFISPPMQTPQNNL